MNDQKLLARSEDKFNELVKGTLTDHRHGDILALSNSELAQSSLTAPCFLEGEPITPELRGRAMRSVLRWVVDTVRPGGEPSWTAFEWRSHNTLDGFYIQQKRIAELAELMGIANQTFYQSRERAIKAVGKRLRAELETPQAVEERQHKAFADRYASLPPDEQLILRIVPTFRGPIVSDLLHQLASEANATNIQKRISNLMTASLLRSNEPRTAFWAHPQIEPYLLTLPSPEERREWHQVAGEHYEQQHAYIEAAHHFRQAGTYKVAAQTLIPHYQAIIDSNQVAELRHLLDQFQPAELEQNAWAQLHLVAGRAAEFMGDSEEALQKYGQALQAQNLRIKAEAYYRRAKVFELTSIDEALAHYKVGINLLKPRPSLEPRRLIQMYIHRAWIFIQERPNLDRAAADLTHAEALITRDYLEEWADLHNAWGELLRHQGEPKRSIEYRFEAWLAATELQDIERKIKIGHNLGIDYVIARQYEQALKYLGESRTLAIEVGNRQMEGACNDHMGGCYYSLGQYEQARDSYLMAHEIHVELGNNNWLGHNCYNLAEVSLELGEKAQPQPYFDQGLAIAKELEDQRLLGEFGQLAQQITRYYIKLGDSSQAQRYFDEGLAIAKESANKKWLRGIGQLAHQITLHYTKQADRKQARRYFNEGLAIAQELKDENLLGEFEQLSLQMSLNQRQPKGVEHLKEHGEITNRAYRDVTGATPKQARNDLKDLVEKGLFKKVGKGRSTKYVLPE